MLQRNYQPQFNLDKESRRLTFYAALFNSPTIIEERNSSGSIVKYREAIGSDAFTETLRNANHHDVVANLNHNNEFTFAMRSDGSLLLQADPIGLFCTCWIPETELGNSIKNRILSGELNSTSFRFVPKLDQQEGDTLVRAKVELFDVCLTSLAAYPQTAGTVQLRTKSFDTKVSYLLSRYRLAKMKR